MPVKNFTLQILANYFISTVNLKLIKKQPNYLITLFTCIIFKTLIMKIPISIISCISLLIFSCKTNQKETDNISEQLNVNTPLNSTVTQTDSVKIIPIEHATTVIEWENKTIYIDPNGGAEAFLNQKKPDLVLITDIHGDHLNIKTLNELSLNNTPLVVPLAVAEKLPENFKEQITLLTNNETKTIKGIEITGIPMYNLRPEVSFHTKGRGNGYVLSKANKKVYISGDSEDIKEMRSLKDIDIALVCMNLPYTMPVENAANAVLEFAPKKVYPYHYRNKDKTLSDVKKFKKMINETNSNIEVIQLDWYPNKR